MSAELIELVIRQWACPECHDSGPLTSDPATAEAGMHQHNIHYHSGTGPEDG